MVKQQFKSLNVFLNWYYTNCQKNIILVHRGTKEEGWAKRCSYLDSKYQPKVPYNHRSIMDREIVIEYDYEDAALNVRLARLVVENLKKDGIDYILWDSGNKGAHVHFLFKGPIPQNLGLFKTTVMKHYGQFYFDDKKNALFRNKTDCSNPEPKRMLPDLSLSTLHLIRAEFGVNEKSQKTKLIIASSKGSPCLSALPQKVYDEYEQAQRNSLAIRIGQQTSDVYKSDIVKMLLDTVQFKENMDDGRARVLFILSQILRPKYRKEGKSMDELVDFMYEWYVGSSTQAPKLSYQQVANQVKSPKDYTITEAYIKRKIEEITGKTWDEINPQKKLV